MNVTLAGSSVAPVFVTVKVSSLVPASPSATEASAIERVGGASSFVIVPSPLSSASVAFVAPLRATVKVSSASYVRSPLTSTVIVFSVSRGRELERAAGGGVVAGREAVPSAVA